MYMTVQTYTSAFGKTCEMKNALAKTDSSDIHGVSTQLINDYKAAGVSVIKDIRDRVDNMMKSLNYIVLLVISCAGALAFVVLFNLSNINITERMREIATIKVLGFYSSEVRAYVFRENIVLTAVGALLGIPLGIWLHRFVMSQIQIDMVSFQVNILPQSYVLALVLTFAFTFAVDLMMQSKLNKISMAESMKSVE
jgi:putative ABC transport system permease protein